MAKELGTRGDNSFNDYVEVLTVEWGTPDVPIESRPIVGKVNTITGVYTPPHY